MKSLLRKSAQLFSCKGRMASFQGSNPICDAQLNDICSRSTSVKFASSTAAEWEHRRQKLLRKYRRSKGLPAARRRIPKHSSPDDSNSSKFVAACRLSNGLDDLGDAFLDRAWRFALWLLFCALKSVDALLVCSPGLIACMHLAPFPWENNKFRTQLKTRTSHPKWC